MEKNLIVFDDVNTKIITIRNQNVLLDSAVAELYGVETKEVNQAIRNNPNKFPEGYVVQLDHAEWSNLKSKFLTSSWGGKNKLPNVFTEKGLYMLATILKSDRAAEATIAIVETFAKLKELTNNLAILNSIDAEIIEPEIIETTGGLFNDLFFSGLPTSAETSIEFNIGLIKGKRKIKYEKPIYQNEFDELKKMMTKMNERLDKL